MRKHKKLCRALYTRTEGREDVAIYVTGRRRRRRVRVCMCAHGLGFTTGMRCGGGGLGGGGSTPPAHVLSSATGAAAAAVTACTCAQGSRRRGLIGDGASSESRASLQLPAQGLRGAIRRPIPARPDRPRRGFPHTCEARVAQQLLLLLSNGPAAAPPFQNTAS